MIPGLSPEVDDSSYTNLRLRSVMNPSCLYKAWIIPPNLHRPSW